MTNDALAGAVFGHDGAVVACGGLLVFPVPVLDGGSVPKDGLKQTAEGRQVVLRVDWTVAVAVKVGGVRLRGHGADSHAVGGAVGKVCHWPGMRQAPWWLSLALK